MAIACLPRAQSAPLRIDTMVYMNALPGSGGWTFEPILEHLLPHVERWGHLGINFISYDDDPDEVTYEKFRHLDAPLLEEFFVSSDDWHDEVDDVDGNSRRRSTRWDWTQWNTPKLRYIKTSFCFPSRLPGYPSLPNLILRSVSTIRQFLKFSRRSRGWNIYRILHLTCAVTR